MTDFSECPSAFFPDVHSTGMNVVGPLKSHVLDRTHQNMVYFCTVVMVYHTFVLLLFDTVCYVTKYFTKKKTSSLPLASPHGVSQSIVMCDKLRNVKLLNFIAKSSESVF